MTMKINKLWFLLAFLLSSPLIAQYGAVNGQCSVGNIKATTQGLNSFNTLMGSYPRCTVTVHQTGTNTLATIYSNSTGTPLSNPFTAQVNALWNFFAVSGSGYDVVLSGGSPIQFPSPITIPGLTTGISGGGNYFIQSNPTTSQTITQPAGTTLNVNNLNYVANAALYCTTPGTLDGTCLSNAATASDSVYLAPLAGNSTYTITSTVTLSQANLKIMCAPGVVIATTLPTSDALVFSGTNQSLIGCTINDAGTTAGEILHINGATNFTMRDDIVTNPTLTYTIRVDGTSGLLVENLTDPGHFQVFGGSSYIRFVNNNVGTAYFQTGTGSSNEPLSEMIVSNNHITDNPTIVGNGGAGITIQQNDTVGTIKDFEVNGNTCAITGTTSPTVSAFGCFSIVSPSTTQCSISNNVMDGVGQYISYAMMELGVNGCNVENNNITATDSFNQAFLGIVSYGGNNNFTGGSINGWGTGGQSGLRFTPQTGQANSGGNVITAMHISNTASTGQESGIDFECNASGGPTSLNNTIGAGTIISGPLTYGIDQQSISAGCNMSSLIDHVLINGATTGIRIGAISAAPNTGTASIGVVSFVGTTNSITTNGSGVLLPVVLGSQVQAPSFVPTGLTPSDSYLCYMSATVGITNVGCPAVAGTVVASSVLTGQTASLGNTTIYTPAANGLYQITINPETSTAGTGSATTVQCHVAYTNPDSHAYTPGITQQVNLLTLGSDSLGGFGSIPYAAFSAESGVPIQYYCTVTGTATGYAYRVSVSLVYLGN